MRRLHTEYRRSRTASARVPAVLGLRPYLEAKPSPHVLLVAFETILRTTGIFKRLQLRTFSPVLKVSCGSGRPTDVEPEVKMIPA